MDLLVPISHFLLPLLSSPTVRRLDRSVDVHLLLSSSMITSVLLLIRLLLRWTLTDLLPFVNRRRSLVMVLAVLVGWC